MWALRKLEAAPGATVTDLPLPELRAGEVTVRVRTASICGTDLHLMRWNAWAERRVHPPLTLGHECAGEVVAVGDGVTTLRPGDRVALESHVVCHACAACRNGQGHACAGVRILGVDRDGVFAERVNLPAENCWPLPDSVPIELASLMEPFGNAVHTALAVPLCGAAVLVTGLGFTGLCACAVAVAAGARRVVAVEPVPERRQLARQIGVEALDPRQDGFGERLAAALGPDGADSALEMSGSPSAIATCVAATRPGGDVAMLGLPAEPVALNLSDGVIMRGLTLHGVTGRRLWQTWRTAAALVGSGRVDLEPFVAARLPLSEWQAAFREAGSGHGKVILEVA
jgi:threonine 3-dehydrogenase